MDQDGIGNPFDIQKLKAVKPKDMAQASSGSLKGERVDISALVPGKDLSISMFREEVQLIFDSITKTIHSSEFAQFNEALDKQLENVKGYSFVFDIEDTLLKNLRDSEVHPDRIYFANPWLMNVVSKLVKNGNNVLFWTSAAADEAQKMMQAMPEDISGSTVITREGFKSIIESFKSLSERNLNESQVLEDMKRIYPNVDASNVEVGKQIFTEALIQKYTTWGERHFFAKYKFPQLFLPADKGFFVDDNLDYIDSAVAKGFPEKRAIKFYNDFRQQWTQQVVDNIVSGLDNSKII